MTTVATGGMRLKEHRGWFAAGNGLRQVIGLLTDGAFKLLVWLCLEARRDSGELEATQAELAHALGKSKRSIGHWMAELEAKGVCEIAIGVNQFERSRFRIADAYWPYQRTVAPSTDPRLRGSDSDQYVAAVRQWFLDLRCGKGSFDPADEAFARELHQRGVPLRTVENALLLGAARKYQSWRARTGSSPICSLRYFDLVIQEAEHLPFSDDYRRYLRGKLRVYAELGARGAVDGGSSARPELSQLSKGGDRH